MANYTNITASWETGTLTERMISRQFDDAATLVSFAGIPTGDDASATYHLIVWMATEEGGEPTEQSPIQLSGPEWLISNFYTQFQQSIQFQLCIQLDGTDDYEAHSPIFSGRIGKSLRHDGETSEIDTATMFDPYKEWVQEQAMAAGAVVIDNTLSVSGAAADAKAVGDALSNTNERLNDLNERITTVEGRVTAIEEAGGYKRYGVSGVGQAASALTRIWDSVGMTAQVGTDGDNSNVLNDFDNATPFNRRKCVGRWGLENGRAVFRVSAYLGDADYAEDGSMGDYVAVECPRAYYYLKNGVLGISAHQYPGWRPFDIFCHDHNPQDTMPYYYIPAYALAVKDGHAVSLPGLDNLQGDYGTLTDAARSYAGDAGAKATIMPAAVNFYTWAMMTVEFATQNMQNVMSGCTSLRHSNDDHAVLRSDGKWLLNNWHTSRVVGEYVSIQPVNVGQNDVSYYASHKITSIIRCDESGAESSSGGYALIEAEDLGLGREYVAGTEYGFVARPYRSGECNSVSTPSGSPVNNINGLYPCKYRWQENPYGNQYKTAADLFAIRTGDNSENYGLDWYYSADPTTISDNPTQAVIDGLEKLDVSTPHENYVNGYIKSKQYSRERPDIWIPGVTTGGSASTYFADYASLVYSHSFRSCRFGGAWGNGSEDGLSYFYAIYAPSNAFAPFGADLFILQ